MVDDETAYAELLATMLTESLGCDVKTFARPEPALAALSELNPAIIITDYYMPEMTGFDFISLASRITPGVPFILITGNALDCEDHEVGPTLPLRAILAKPFSWKKLADEIVANVPELAPKPAQA